MAYSGRRSPSIEPSTEHSRGHGRCVRCAEGNTQCLRPAGYGGVGGRKLAGAQEPGHEGALSLTMSSRSASLLSFPINLTIQSKIHTLTLPLANLMLYLFFS
jgi:hypothetical protein